MFTRFEKDFATHTAVLANTGAQLTVSDTTLLETKHGWRSATLLKPGMEVATLDGGFKPIASVKRASE